MSAFCFYPCSACGHLHYGATDDYRCPNCDCHPRHDCEADNCSAKKAA